MTRPQKWGQILLVGKDFRNDAGIDVDAYIRGWFDESLPEGSERVGDVEVEWIDGDDTESMAGRLNREMYLDAGMEPPKNVWYVRITGNVALGVT